MRWYARRLSHTILYYRGRVTKQDLLRNNAQFGPLNVYFYLLIIISRCRKVEERESRMESERERDIPRNVRRAVCIVNLVQMVAGSVSCKIDLCWMVPPVGVLFSQVSALSEDVDGSVYC